MPIFKRKKPKQKEHKPIQKKKSGGVEKYFQRISEKDKINFTGSLATMIDSGLTIVESLEIIKRQTKKAKMKEMVSAIVNSIKGGQSLSLSLAAHPKIFPATYVGLIKTGEESGRLNTILSELTKQMERARDIKRKVRGAMYYPIFVVFVIFAVVSVIMVFVVPKLKEVYSGTGVALPGITQALITVSDFVAKYWYIIFPGLIGFIFLFFWFGKKTRPGKRFYDKLALKLPIFGQIVSKGQIISVTSNLALMLDSGVPIIDALDVISRVGGNVYYYVEVQRIKKEIQGGKSLSEAIWPGQSAEDIETVKENPYFPIEVSQIINVGEQSGRVNEMLWKIADNYTKDVNNIVKTLSTLLEPVLIIGIGIVVGFVALAIMMPFFTIANVIK